jgi:hypothetical protein
MGFLYVKNKSRKITEVIIKEGIFVGPQINCEQFDDELNKGERTSWQSFKAVTKNFWENRKAENCCEILGAVLKSHKTMGCDMSLK